MFVRVVICVCWGVGCVGAVQRVSLGLRGCRSGSCPLLTVDFEDSQRPLSPAALSTLFPSALDWTASQCRLGVVLSLWRCRMSLRLSLGPCLMGRAQGQWVHAAKAVCLFARWLIVAESVNVSFFPAPSPALFHLRGRAFP